MSSLVCILGADDWDVGKIVFWVFVAVIWGIATLVGALKNKIKQQQRRRAAEELPIDLTPRMEVRTPLPPPLPPPGRQMAWQMNVPSALASRGPAPRGKKAAAVRPPPIRPQVMQQQAPARVVVQQPSAPIQPSRAIEAAVSVRPASRGGGAGAGSRAASLASVLRPQSLRTQWMLTEVLNKPLALRDEP